MGSYDFFQNTWNTTKAPQVILTCTGPSSLDFHVRAPDNLTAILLSLSDGIKMRIAVPLCHVGFGRPADGLIDLPESEVSWFQ